MSSQSLPVQAKQLFHYLFEQASLGIAVEDLDGKLLLANPALCAMLGYEDNELCGMNCSQFASDEDSKDDWALFQQLTAGVIDQYSLEKRYLKKDGASLWGNLNVSLLQNGDGGSPLVFAFVEDITERRRTEEALRESEERFRLATRAGKMFAYEWDAATDIVVRSGECSEISGIAKPGEVTTGQEILTRVHPDDREKLLAADAALTAEKPNLQVSHRLIRPDGRVVWAERSGRAYFDEHGKMLRIVGMVADITERKEAEEALRRSESNYRLFVAQSSEGIFCQELDRPIPIDSPEDEQVQRILQESYMAECNDALARMYGLSPADFVGKRLTETVDAQDPVNVQLTRDYIRGGYRVVDRESHEVDLQGNAKIFLNSMIGIVEEGMLLRTWGIQRDITDRRRAEEALASVSRRLIEAQEQERTRIGRELHDDIGQRLSMLTIGLEQLQTEPPDLPAEFHSRLTELRKQTSEIAADLQSLSHELHSAKLEYLGIAAAMRAFCREFGDQQNVEIDIRTDDLTSPVPPDVSLCLFRILQEALHNSAKHSGVRHFEVRLWETPGEAHLTVSDSGAGFDREAAKQGRGLGLISMEERLRLLNGTLSIDSQPQRGTAIRARVPLRGIDLIRAAG